jgi:hypothetical protein
MRPEIFMLISNELERQNELHGEENLELINNKYLEHYKELTIKYKEINKAKTLLTWDDILLEEIYEALSENEFEKQKEELIQVAATAIRIIESLERNKK